MINVATTKMCPHCERELAVGEFYPHGKSGGLQGWCKACASESRRAAYVKRTLKKKVVPESKICSRCKLRKSGSDFSKHRGSNDGLHCECKKCNWLYVTSRKEANKDTRLKREYGISMDDYNQMLAIQNERCDGCGKKFNHYPHVDHCHSTGRVRGLLCYACNCTLGHVKDNPETLRNLAMYLEQQLPELVL